MNNERSNKSVRRDQRYTKYEVKMKPLEYIDLKNAIDHLENELENLSRAYLLSKLSLKMLKKELETVPKPNVVKEKDSPPPTPPQDNKN